MSTYERLVGTWRMLSLRIEMKDTGEIIEPWGTHPAAWLILTPEGRLMTVGTASDRSRRNSETRASIDSESTTIRFSCRDECAAPPTQAIARSTIRNSTGRRSEF